MFRTVAVALVLSVAATSAMAAEAEAVVPITLRPPSTPFRVPAVALTPLVGKRPMVLPALYGGFVALQALDGYTTAVALDRGASEANPILRQGHSGTMWAVKAATTAGTVYFVERLWKRHRVAAVLVMAGVNGGLAAVAAHNARQGR